MLSVLSYCLRLYIQNHLDLRKIVLQILRRIPLKKIMGLGWLWQLWLFINKKGANKNLVPGAFAPGSFKLRL